MNLTTIIPVHTYNEDVDKFLREAINSVREQKGIDTIPNVLIVYAASLEKDKLFKDILHEQDSKVKISFFKNDGNTDFQSQINLGVKNIETDWFSILEFDDELSTTYYKNVLHHIEKLEKIDLLLPVLVEVNDKNEALKLTNETVWSKQFVGENGEMGYLNTNALNQYTDFKISGAVFKKSTFESVGCLKSNITLTFTYEFLLRMLNNGANIYTIPKIGVKHLVMREGSLFDTYAKTLTNKEKKFWFDTAKKESNFFNDRVIDMSLLLEKSE